MFNPEKLLGGLMRSGMRGSGMKSMASGGIALGLVGVAMEAVEHYMSRTKTDSSRAAPPPQPSPGTAPPPPPPGQTASPPPLPGADSANGGDATQQDAVLLIRAMIAAANADGVIDAQERSHILEKLKAVDLTEEEHRFIVHELLEPRNMQAIVDAVQDAGMARQVYAASLMAITIDCEAEETYLQALSEGLGLDTDDAKAIRRQLGK